MAESRRFFRVMMPGFRSKLYVSCKQPLPVAFCRQIKGEGSDRAVVKSSDREWHIKVGKCCDGSLYFEEGWEDFVKHHGLNLGDFVVFEYNGDLVFDAIVFDSSACEKEIPVSINLFSEKMKNKNKNKKKKKKILSDEGKSPLEDAKSYPTNGPHFITTINASNGPDGISYLHIPVEFAKSQKLDRASIVILRDSSGKLWPVKLCTSDFKFRGKMLKRTAMRKGWLHFYVANKLKKGDVCLFELDLTRKKSYTLVMDVHIFPLVL
ncbi:B3 domain-containing protein Os03g0212300 isoform X3 [Ricinus communis]|uniref:B3 domain-containing protein Os03g0212300 isoform X3 n=1 Tax=Ricinus communis TaxID=3988 RepID=UPI00201AC0F6|nr:B3 domain-containing protein Os03g0212300 isoform X3 [Ricinus communis]